MGFFKSIGRGIGKFVEGVGKVVGSEKIQNVGRNIQSACAEKIASEKKYNKSEADIYTTDRLNEILVSFSEGYRQQAIVIEQSCISLVEEYYDELIKIIEDVHGNTYNQANLKALKNGKNRIANSIKGGITEPLAKRMSLDDYECLSILKMDPGNEKKIAMTTFSKKVIREALTNLSNKVRETLKEQTEDIREYLCDISDEQEKAMKKLKVQFDKMVADNELDQSSKEKNCVVPMYIVDASEVIRDMLK